MTKCLIPKNSMSKVGYDKLLKICGKYSQCDRFCEACKDEALNWERRF